MGQRQMSRCPWRLPSDPAQGNGMPLAQAVSQARFEPAAMMRTSTPAVVLVIGLLHPHPAVQRVCQDLEVQTYIVAREPYLH